MASLIPGFEYDIFISYRQKDNKGDRWVSEFVETLKTELESTFKEVITGLTSAQVAPVKESVQSRESIEGIYEEEKQALKEKHAGINKPKLYSGIAAITILIIAAMLAFPKIFKKDELKHLKDPDGRISIAVMPFRNMTNDTLWNVWQDGIQDILITSLSNSEELKVRQMGSITGLLQSKRAYKLCFNHTVGCRFTFTKT